MDREGSTLRTRSTWSHMVPTNLVHSGLVNVNSGPTSGRSGELGSIRPQVLKSRPHHLDQVKSWYLQKLTETRENFIMVFQLVETEGTASI